MVRNRTWMLHLNLDAFNAAWLTLDSIEERSSFLTGLCKGMNDGKLPDGSNDALIDGFEMGNNMRQEAEGYRESRRVIGLLGGNPNLKQNHKDNHVVKGRLTSPLPEANHMDNAILNPQSFNQEPITKSLSSPSAHRPLDEYASIWNGKLAGLGYGKMERATPKREKTLQERKKADPNFLETFTKAVAYLAEDSWWRSKAKQFTIDLLFQPDRAQTLSEKAPSKGETNGSKSPAHRASVDEAYKQQLRERERIQPKPNPTPEDDAALDALFGVQ